MSRETQRKDIPGAAVFDFNKDMINFPGRCSSNCLSVNGSLSSTCTISDQSPISSSLFLFWKPHMQNRHNAPLTPRLALHARPQPRYQQRHRLRILAPLPEERVPCTISDLREHELSQRRVDFRGPAGSRNGRDECADRGGRGEGCRCKERCEGCLGEWWR